MGETPDELRERVERARHRLGEDLNQLEDSVKEQLDWRNQFDRRPWAFLGAVFGAAMVVGLAIGHEEREAR